MYFSKSSHSSLVSLRSVYRPSPFGGHPFHWVEAGNGEQCVIFLHGIMAHSMAFRRIMEASAGEFRIIVPDLPGHGQDRTYQSPEISANIDGLLLWLEGLLETIPHHSIHLVGHSLGATLAYRAALTPARFPHISRLVLVSPGLQIGVPAWTGAIMRRFPARLARLGVSRAGIRLYEPLQWRRARMDAQEIHHYLQPIRQVERIRHILGIGADLMATTGSLAEAHKVELPSLIIWGDRDHLLPLPTAYELTERIPDSRLEVFSDCGHCPMEDCPGDFHRALGDFLLPP